MSLAVLADHMASKGRGPDSMLIHMSPREVRGLQALAEHHGGTLTINPETGLPEANFLEKLLPTIIGAGISYFSGGMIDPMTAAAMVGGVETVRTGDIGRGISAGFQAYGGANLTAGLTEAGTSTIGAAEAAKGLTMSPELLAEFGGDSARDALLQQQVTDKMAAATPFEKLSYGAEAFKNNPMGMTKSLATPAAMAFAPAILAEMGVKSNMPQTVTKPGMIAPYASFGGQYVAGTPYQASPTRAAEGGLMGMNNGGYSPGQLNFAERSEPVVRMASGGVVALAAGGDYRSLTKDSSAADIASAYKQAVTASGGDTAANQKVAIDYLTNLGIGQDKIGQAYGVYQASPTYTDYTQQNVTDYLTANKDINIAEETARLNANPFLVNQAISQIASGYTGPTQTTAGSGAQQYYDAYTNRGIDANELYAANLALKPDYDFYGETGDAGLASLNRAFNVAKQFDTYEYDKAGGTQLQKDIAALRQYDLGNLGGDRTQQIKDIARETGLSLDEAARRYDAARASMATKKTTIVGGTGNDVITKDTVVGGTGNDTTVGGTGNDVITAPITYKTDGTNAPGGLESVLGLPPGVSGAGITTVNPNGTITTRPDLSLEMQDVRDAYTAGGGSLGVNKNLFAPKTSKEIEDRYKLTGGSKQAMDYLTGKTKYTPIPYTEDGQISKSYAESVMKIPVASSSKMYIFKNGKFEPNPDYAIPTYDKDGKKSLNLTNADVKTFMDTKPSTDAFYTWATTNNLSPEQIALASDRPINEISKLFTGAKDLVGEDGKIDQTKLDEKTAADEKTNFDYVAYLKANPDVQAELDAGKANFGTKDDPAAAAYEHYLRYGKADGRKYIKKAAGGGLMNMAMARGGMAEQYDLGGYSDGGRLLRGPGDGVSDSIPATIGNKRPARLADGEFVVPARIVSELGNGSTEAGARKLYAMMDRVQRARRGTVGKGRVAKNSRSDKYLPA